MRMDPCVQLRPIAEFCICRIENESAWPWGSRGDLKLNGLRGGKPSRMRMKEKSFESQTHGPRKP